MADAADLATALDGLVDELEMAPPPRASAERRRGDRTPAAPESTTLRLVRQGEVLVVQEPAEAASAPGGLRRGRRSAAPAGEVAWQRELSLLDRSKIGEWLDTLDRKLTPNTGLRELRGGELVPVAAVPQSGRVLLWVHGTFSSNDSIFEGLRSHEPGRAFLGWAERAYDRILSFDHPTLSLSPMLNARALGLALGPTPAAVDVICHSRGGLVTRWWLESFDRGDPARRRAVFVGSPLAGTGLAAPPNLRGSLSLLGTVADALGAVSAAVPFLTVMAGVFRVVSSVTKLAAKTPAIDAAVALVPGLAAQSRVGNNAELLSLRREAPSFPGRYFAVQANFESDKPGWRFWRYFRGVGARAKDAAADLVFDGPNDLVVDTGSMAELSSSERLPESQVYDFQTTDRVHHTNYFEQPETFSAIRGWLGSPAAETLR